MAARHQKIMHENNRVDYVQIDGLVVLKIAKHCHEESNALMDLAQGVLLGLINDTCVEITNCFPFPRHSEDEDFDENDYQVEMMRQMREVNIDHLHVGWYQSSQFGTFFTRPVLESQFAYQTNITESVVLIYDPVRTVRGFLSLKAYRLTDAAVKLVQENEYTAESFKKTKAAFDTLYEEIPVIIRNSYLVNLLMCELTEMVPRDYGKQFLDLSTGFVLEKELQLAMECVDNLNQETNKFLNYQRQVHRQNQNKQIMLQRRAQENYQRKQRGESPLPTDDIEKMFKPIPAPPRLDSVLLAGQVNSYCQQMSQFSTQSLGKLFIAEALQTAGPSNRN